MRSEFATAKAKWRVEMQNSLASNQADLNAEMRKVVRELEISTVFNEVADLKSSMVSITE